MNTASASQLFQSDRSLAVGQERAAKAQRTAHGAAFGAPIWLGSSSASPLPASTNASADGDAVPLDVSRITAAAGGADGGAAKVLAACRSSVDSALLYTAESGRVVRQVDLEAGRTERLLRGHTGPVSAAAALVEPRSGRPLVFTGAWDKSIRVWAAEPLAQIGVVPDAASDFIKALCAVPTHRCLLSGGSDRTVRAWDIGALLDWVAEQPGAAWPPQGALGPTPALLGAFREHTRPVTCIAALPPAPDAEAVRRDAQHAPEPALSLFTADSMGRVLQIHAERTADAVRFSCVRELNGHETSVSALVAGWRSVDADAAGQDAGMDEQYVPEVWTASADKSVRRFSLAPSAERPGAGATARRSHAGGMLGSKAPVFSDVVLEHPEAATSVLPLTSSAYVPQLGEAGRWVLTGTAEGGVVVWALEPDTDAPRRLNEAEGHWHEVTYVDLWRRAAGWHVVTAGLDGTVRRWALPDLVATQGGDEAPVVAAKAASTGADMTAEEEAELEELLE